MDNIKTGFMATVAALLVTIMIYLARTGGEKYLFLTDLMAVIYSFSAVVLGIFAVKIYSMKSLQGKALFLILIGTASWFTAELIWLVFSQVAGYYSESLRILGYIPLVIAFFGVLQLSNPMFRQHKKKILPLFGVFLVFAVIYLNLIPVIFGVSLLESLLTAGYIVLDFVLLFGIFLLLKACRECKKGAISTGWLIIAIAFVSVFIFDVYFAFYYNLYQFGDMVEIFWLANYILLSYGFFYHNQIMKNLLGSNIQENEKSYRNPVILAAIIIFLSVLSVYLLTPLATVSSGKTIYVVEYRNFTEFAIEERDDVSVVFTRDVLDRLNNEYKPKGEYLFCLIGYKNNNEIYVDDLFKPELIFQGEEIVVAKEDPACKIENSVGSIHSHPRDDCRPSINDIFSWGEMRNPEPLIGAIQCDIDTFYLMVMPGKNEPLDFRSAKWRIA